MRSTWVVEMVQTPEALRQGACDQARRVLGQQGEQRCGGPQTILQETADCHEQGHQEVQPDQEEELEPKDCRRPYGQGRGGPQKKG